MGILNKYKSIDDFQAITYIKEDHTIYFDNEWYRDASDMVREPLYEIKENQIYLTNEFWKDSHDYLLLFLVPVMNGEERNGFVVALKECGGILDGDAFSYLRKSGDLILTDEKGVILDCNLTNDNNGILHSRVYIFRIQRKDPQPRKYFRRRKGIEIPDAILIFTLNRSTA